MLTQKRKFNLRHCRYMKQKITGSEKNHNENNKQYKMYLFKQVTTQYNNIKSRKNRKEICK